MDENLKSVAPFALLIFGVGALYLANHQKPKKKQVDRTGEICDPMGKVPLGYQCVSDGRHFKLYPEGKNRLGYSPFADKKDVDDTIEQLGFYNGDVKEFQTFMSQTTKWNLRTDGFIDKETLLALQDAKDLKKQGVWHKA